MGLRLDRSPLLATIVGDANTPRARAIQHDLLHDANDAASGGGDGVTDGWCHDVLPRTSWWLECIRLALGLRLLAGWARIRNAKRVLANGDDVLQAIKVRLHLILSE